MDSKAKPVRPRLVEAIGDELGALLGSVAPQTFVHEYWGKKPLFVKGFPEKFKGFFDLATFFKAVANPGSSPAGHLRASFDKKTPPARAGGGEPVDATQNFPIPPELAAPLYEAGATLCMTEIDTRVPRLAYFAAAIKRQLGYPGFVAFNAYLSGPGAGLNWHFDARIASTLQIEGTKRWRFSKKVPLEWPRGNAVMMSDGSVRYDTNAPRADWERLTPPDKSAISEVVLEPGDFLVLPAGAWHDASGGATGSLALNLAFNPVPYTYVLSELVDTLLARDPEWRSAKPLVPRLDGAAGEVDPRALESLGSQLTKAADALRSIAADSAALVALWSSLVQTGSPPIDPPAPGSGQITPADRFRVRADGNVYALLAEGGTRLSATIGSRRTEFSGGTIRFVQRALAAKRFEAQDCAVWGEGDAKLAWSEVEATLARLLADGLIERVTK